MNTSARQPQQLIVLNKKIIMTLIRKSLSDSISASPSVLFNFCTVSYFGPGTIPIENEEYRIRFLYIPYIYQSILGFIVADICFLFYIKQYVTNFV